MDPEPGKLIVSRSRFAPIVKRNWLLDLLSDASWNSLFSLSHWRVDFMSPRWRRKMLKSGGENGTSFLNSRKVKSVHSAFYFWKMASKFQEMGGILDFVPWNFVFFPCNFFFVRWNFYFLGRFFYYKPWFLHESAQFSSERREIPKKTSCFSAQTSRSCEIQKL